MSRHTPGPWKVFGGPGRLRHSLAVIDSIPDVDGKIIANCICHVATTNDDCDANAKLIAAAPELLHVLRDVVVQFQDEFDGPALQVAKDLLRTLYGD